MPYLEPIGMDADDVSSEFDLKNAKVLLAVEPPDDDDHSKFIENGNVFALDQGFAKIYVDGKLVTVGVAMPTTVNTALYLIGEDGFHWDDYRHDGPRDNTLYQVLLHISDVAPESSMTSEDKDGIFFLEDGQFEEMEKASPT
ncbi:hypothetical protein [Agrobacterium sp. Azo12]|uniref:hypothetical protein n=1 Tax=Agrobacterium sp. Azo12 TaxID=3031129 RepID=UPI0023D7DA04|nr:hypothetical protein [Agrobacterium sp. Azo12]MDO5897896.1 hypothetical protein [Agrobacterium sp. Azo12]